MCFNSGCFKNISVKLGNFLELHSAFILQYADEKAKIIDIVSHTHTHTIWGGGLDDVDRVFLFLYTKIQICKCERLTLHFWRWLAASSNQIEE